jgi:Carbohydrate family 9 binding domain-like
MKLGAGVAVRGALVALALVHTFPARKHVGLFLQHPSWEEGWKGFGAVIAIAIYLLPLKVYVRALGFLWARSRIALALGGWVLAAVHAVPAGDHLPRLLAEPTWGDAWRGVGAALACAWFLAPLRVQAVALRALRPNTFLATGEVWMDRAKAAVVVLVGVVLGGALGARAVANANHARVHAPRPPPPTTIPATVKRELHVPHATASIEPNGEVDEPVWATAVRTNAFTTGGKAARPYSDARLLWGDGFLYVTLYAGDEDIRATDAKHDDPLWVADAFQLVFVDGARERTIDVSPLGIVTDGERVGNGTADYRWESHARVGHDTDGTVNAPDDDDEEWVIEMAIPLDSLGLAGHAGDRIGFSARRCDATRQIGRVCAGWGDSGDGVLVLDE